MTVRERMRRYRENGAGAGLQLVQVLVPPAGRTEIVARAAELRQQHRLAQTSAADDGSTPLSGLVERALRDYGTTCFWNVRTDLATADMARLAIRKLRKYGGMSGWGLAKEIAAALEDGGGNAAD